MVIAQIRKNENLRCIRLIDFLSQVYRLALVSARNMLVTLGPNFSSNFALDPMGKSAERLLLRSAATDYTHIYTVNSIQTGTCLGQKSAQKIV